MGQIMFKLLQTFADWHTESGIIVFHIISGKLSKKARVEVLLDDGYWPCFSTMKARSSHAQFGYVGEGFMKEVDFGRVWFRLNDGAENEKDDIIAECKEDAKTFLQAALVSFLLQCLYFPFDYNTYFNRMVLKRTFWRMIWSEISRRLLLRPDISQCQSYWNQEKALTVS